MIAIIEAHRAGLLKFEHWLPNIIAGIIVGVVALPLAMAFAIASGVTPAQGIYTAIIAGLTVSLCGGSRIQIAGPTGAFVVILAGVTAKFGVDGLLTATFIAGLFLILLGLARFGAVIRFIPDPVIVGFTAGIGVIIWVGQWHDFFGLQAVGGEAFYQKVWHLLGQLPHLNWTTTGLGIMSVMLVLLSPKIRMLARVPSPLIAMLAVTLLNSVFHFQGVATIGSAFGGIPRSLPHLTLPDLSFNRIILLLPSAFTIAMLGAIESLLSAVVADGMAGTRHDSNQELIGQGIANILSPLFGGIAATGAIARTATNFRNGANSPLAGIAHSLTLLLVLLLLAPFAALIPLCALSGILFVVAWNMSDVRQFVRLLTTAPRADTIILLITFTLTIFTDLVVAVNIGVILALLQFLRRMAESVSVVVLDHKQLAAELRDSGWHDVPDDVVVLSIEGPLFFAAVDSVERALAVTQATVHGLVISLKRVPFMDITGINGLTDAIVALEQRGIKVGLCEANHRVLTKLVRAGLIRRRATPARYFRSLGLAVSHCHQGWPAQSMG